MLLKRILEEVSGRSYRELVAERIARPLALSRTFVPEAIPDLGTLRTGSVVRHHSRRDTARCACALSPWLGIHGVVASTASDIVRFRALFYGRMLSRRSLDDNDGCLFVFP